MTSDSSRKERKHERTPVSLLVQYRFNSLEDFLAEYAVNLSPGGIFIATDDPSPIGTMLYLQFSLKDGSKLIEGMGRVAHVQHATAQQPRGMGIEFVQFDEASMELIARICGGR
jgi:molecular chaperone DnaK